MNVYVQNGFKDRNDYLSSLSDDYGIHIEDVRQIASLLGESEDFDGLVIALEDYAEEIM